MSKIQLSPQRGWREAGMVSIMVTMVLMIVVSLIVLGFAQISRRNQRQALDRQLSTQAFYAAETGVNDAVDVIKSAVASGTAITAKSSCASSAPYDTHSPAIGGASTGVSYTCLLVNPTPDSLKYDSVGMNGVVAPMTPSSGTIASITFTWSPQPTQGMSTCPNSLNSVFSPTTTWSCGNAVLRVDLVPTSGSLSMASLQTSTMTTFMVPFSTGGTSSTNGSSSLVGVSCPGGVCSMTVTGLNSTQYYVRIIALYNQVSVGLEAKDASGNILPMKDTQVLIDSTGKAQDVLRRIQVRVPLASSSSVDSDFGLLSTEAVCKRFAVMGGKFFNDSQVGGAAQVISSDPTMSGSTTNPLCITPSAP